MDFRGHQSIAGKACGIVCPAGDYAWHLGRWESDGDALWGFQEGSPPGSLSIRAWGRVYAFRLMFNAKISGALFVGGTQNTYDLSFDSFFVKDFAYDYL